MYGGGGRWGGERDDGTEERKGSYGYTMEQKSIQNDAQKKNTTKNDTVKGIKLDLEQLCFVSARSAQFFFRFIHSALCARVVYTVFVSFY